MFAPRSVIAAAMFAAATAFAPATFADDSHGHGHDHGKMDHGDKAKPVMAGDLHISGYWTRAMLPGQKVGGGYLVITNNGSDHDRMVAISTPHTDRAEIHEMKMVDDVMKMRELEDGLHVPAGETVVLEPGGYHLMFMAVTTPFKEGDMVPVTLTFEKAGDVELMLPVMAAGTKKMDHGGHSH